MMSWLKRLVAPVAAVAVFGLLPAASRADSVAYHTVVTFTSAGSGATLVNGQQIQLNGTSETLTAGGQSETEVPLLPTGTTVSFGGFTASAGTTIASFIGTGVQIDIFQDYTTPPGDLGAPASGPGTFVGSATGTIGAGAFSSATLNITSATQFILPTGAVSFPPGVWYTIASSQHLNLNGSTGLFNIAGSVSAVPLPGVAWVGLTLLGGFGGARGLKRFRRVGELTVA
jgi:hypothetical protein